MVDAAIAAIQNSTPKSGTSASLRHRPRDLGRFMPPLVPPW